MLSIVGYRAASLASVAIGELYSSAYNNHYKLIAFSDSVRDAAHRAGFFGARIHSQVVRHALAGGRNQGEGMARNGIGRHSSGRPEEKLEKT